MTGAPFSAPAGRGRTRPGNASSRPRRMRRDERLADGPRGVGQRDVIQSLGYAGVAVLIALENLLPPIPSEVILPLAGFLVGRGRFAFLPVLAASTAGSRDTHLAGAHSVGRQRGRGRAVSRVGEAAPRRRAAGGHPSGPAGWRPLPLGSRRSTRRR